MFHRQTHPTGAPSKRRAPNKLIAGLAAVLATGVIGTASLVGAAPNPTPGNNGNGYGGNVGDTNISLDLNLSNSRDNIINIVVNIFR